MRFWRLHTHRAHRAEGLLPLTELENAEHGIVQELHGGAGFRSRLAALGFTPGVTVAMLRNRRHGPVIVTIRDTRIVLGRGEAHRVLIVPAEE